MKTTKNTLFFIASFIVVGLFVLLIDKLYPTPPIDQAALQFYSSRDALTSLDK